MGWQDRDWGKFTDDERRAFFGSSSTSDRGTPTSGGHQPVRSAPIQPKKRRRKRVRLERRRSDPFVAASVCVIAVATFAYNHHLIHLGTLGHPHKTVVIGDPVTGLKMVAPAPAPTVVRPPSKVIAIRWRASDIAPAAAAGRICVHDPRHGTICATYVVGEKPADNLTRRIESLGLRVESSG